ncbi:DNA-deoxyinosine glycosylase [Rheinheimera baltica]|uniref:DNA-deoxyinosine glycosylase n=1 Tax=Rheinheimera baltica TaxID=67576 RepID=A0ABT9I210_9GAMM|nr:DNA-deoxyinosine glycosylase [Rheinheimera baltica]MDP5137427.1 DNA-deoxyinosine glycosylase [Rheinheimera baltica]MDP5144735.1 DNA-deoxyinosine glycosylase [Rheinheimera baltica]MDP5151968.1 DNA-deoxyinosine glycosylase [Rheinheimera baltica]MDP5190166.1 DNA-deoxyinosine glycosylase [Rheinheimera baltica]
MNPSLDKPALNGLAAQSTSQAKVLVLGSMPGAISLLEQQYYAHPRNQFWPIMAEIGGFSANLSYQDKVEALNTRGVALWDVIASCQRSGSLDSAIRDEQPNDFAGFFATHSQLVAIGFNGAKAWQSFKRYVLPRNTLPSHIQLLNLPSTSPAYAAMSFAHKLKVWQQLKPFLL